MTRAARPPDTGAWGFAALWAVLLVGGVALRIEALTHGITTDEIGNVLVRTWRAAFFDPESGVNPPLWRWLGVPWPTDRMAIGAGRGLAFVTGVATLVLVGDAARRTGGRLSALVATAIVACAPACIRDSALDRAYAAGACTLAAVLWIAAREQAPSPAAGAERATRRVDRWQIAAVGLTALLPWWHYLLFPVAALWMVAGSRGVSWRLRLGAAVLAWTPLLVPLVLGRSRREALDDGWVGPTLEVLSGGVHPAPRVYDLLASLGLRSPAQVEGALLVGVVLLTGLVWSRLLPAARLAWLGAVGVAVAVALGEQVHFVRSDAATFWFVPVAVLLSTVGASAGAWAHALTLVAVGAGLFVQLPHAAWARRDEGPRQDGLAELGAWWGGDTALVVHPAYVAGALWFQRTGTSQTLARDAGPCRVADACFHEGEASWRGSDRLAPAGATDVVTLTPWVDATAMAGCVVVVDRPGWRAWRCPP